eukprot:m.154407 g.154407  ORF g.154407 m.154407 type:complete len:55 (+) comp16383_c0_seq11:133-297(+)
MASIDRTRLDELSDQARASNDQLRVAVSRTASKPSQTTTTNYLTRVERPKLCQC